MSKKEIQKMPKKSKTPTEDELAAKLEEAKKVNLGKFQNEFRALSRKYGFDFGAKAFITDDGRVAGTVVIIPRRENR